MACSKAHGPQAFIRYVADKTGETITQQDWHDVRQLAREQGGDMSKGQVSAQDAIATLQALSAKIAADEAAAKKSGTKAKSVDEMVAEMVAKRAAENGGKSVESIFAEGTKRMRENAASPVPKPAPAAPAPAPTMTAPPASPEGKAQAALIGAKVTRGTLAVMRFFATHGVKPVLAYVRARREENKRMKKAVKTVKRYKRIAAGY